VLLRCFKSANLLRRIGLRFEEVTAIKHCYIEREI
jgi:hypothetical protein